MGWFWKDSRFGWPFVTIAVALTATLVAADLVWRTVVMPIETLLILVAAAVALEVAAGLVWWLSRRASRKS